MAGELKLSIGQHSEKGRKEANQDFHGAMIPAEPALSLKGIAIALADGISTSAVGRDAAESAVKSFLTDYYCTSDSWSVKTSAQRVIGAANSWLHAQTRRSQYAYERDRGYVCTLSVVVVKSRTAHIFHVGDSRVYRVSGNALEQLTTDHRIMVSSEQTYLGRALGVAPQVEIDYQAIELERGDVLILATDGVYEHIGDRPMIRAIGDNARDLDGAARQIVAQALEQGSDDNLTLQVVRVDELPDGETAHPVLEAASLPVPALLEPRQSFDGYTILRQLHASSRSHIYLAADEQDGSLAAIKIPSIDLRGDAAYLKRFMMEEWIARRLDSAHVLKPRPQTRPRAWLYVATEFVDGRTLGQWMVDNPRPDLGTVRDIVEQIARGLQAFHRKEMLHQDLRPENVMIDRNGTARIIDFGSALVAGIVEATPSVDPNAILGTAQYTAPEYFLGEGGTQRSDIYSLGAIAYQMLTGRLPYGARMAQARSRRQQAAVPYQSVLDDTRDIPTWIDATLRKAVHPDPNKRYTELSEFLYDLRHPNKALLDSNPSPLLDRNPLLFWKGLSFLLGAALIVVLALHYNR